VFSVYESLRTSLDRQSIVSPISHRLGRTHRWPTRKRCRGVERIKAGGRAEEFFSKAASYLSVEGRGIQGKVELAEALSTVGVV
jgi:hypothetical protein